MDEVIAKAVKVLLATMSWQGIALALALAVLYAVARVYGPRLRDVKVEPADDPDHRDREPSVLTDSNGTPLQPRTDDDGGQG